ncbi:MULTISPECIES: hypothetical protein [Nocardioides]|uniref:Uncharacterized protein n=1 Tax=Nocardioides vastitatis TaxID=2568655 RepID=A0ABW0ZHC0_9ACTN|nr:hypothetical protein [Nocardioides sp.]
MTDTQATARLEMRWVSVTGADGRTRMESHWDAPGQATVTHTHAAA